VSGASDRAGSQTHGRHTISARCEDDASPDRAAGLAQAVAVTAPAAARRPALTFVAGFLAIFVALFAGYEGLRGSTAERFAVEGLVLMPTASLINALTPGASVAASGRALVSPRARLAVTRGCEGAETALLIVAAVLAYPASWRRRAIGLLGGIALAYVLGIVRLALLYYALAWARPLFASTHELILPLLPVVLIAAYFVRWAARSTTAPDVATR